jgi:methionyl-tRNA formyltransferase
LDGNHEIVGVVTRPDAPKGRSRRLAPSQVAEVASEHGLELARPVSLRDTDFREWLSARRPDVCAVVAYGALVPEDLLALPGHGWVNVHYSLLPRWRGAAPVQRAILAGDAETGVSVFQLAVELDSGPVYAQRALPVAGRNTGELLDVLTGLGAETLAETLDGIESGTATAVPQPLDGVTLAPKLSPDDGCLDWSEPADALERRVRACNPAPMAWTTLDGARVRIAEARMPADMNIDPDTLEPGVLEPQRKRLLVGTGSEPLELTLVQPDGRKPMRGADWGRGLRDDRARFDNWKR